MTVTDSEERRNRILGSIVETYILTASPVGSEVIARKLHSSLSPATIRNIMGELEAAGLLEQPHTSAGRVPTDQGYRVYVDRVMETRPLGPDQLHQLVRLVGSEDTEFEGMLERVSSALAELTQEAAFVVAPSVKQSTVRQIEFVPISVRKILCVLVSNEEILASHVVEVEEPMSRDEAAALVRFLNTELTGLPFNDLLGSLERRLLAQNDSFYYLVKRSLGILQQALSTEPSDRLMLEGMSYMIAQPEFSRDPRKAHQLLRGLDAQEPFLQRLRTDLANRGVQVRIGREAGVTGLEECSYVTASFSVGGEVVGGVGVLGPKRMDYARISALVDGMARALTQMLTSAQMR